MKRAKKEVVIILWGGEEIQNYYNYAKWTKPVVQAILDHTVVYDFDTFEEGEAFRQGMAATLVATARDFMEVPPEGFKSLKKIADFHQKKVAQKRVA